MSNENKQNIITFATAGQVDNGKTTFSSFALSVLGISKNDLDNLAKDFKPVNVNIFDNLKEEKERGVTINANIKNSNLKLESGDEISVNLVDCPGHGSYTRQTVAGTSAADFIFLLVDVTTGITNHTRQHIDIIKAAYGGGKHLTKEENKAKLANKKLGIILNKLDLLDDQELLMLVESEVEEVLEENGFNLDNVHMHRTSALCALSYLEDPIKNIKDKDYAVKLREFIAGLVKTIFENRDVFLQRDESKEFLMYIDGMPTVRGAGMILTGTVLQGTLRPGDKVYVQGVPTKQQSQYVVSSIQGFHSDLSAAYAGYNVGIKLTGIKAEDVRKGGIITAKPLDPVKKIKIKAYFNTFAEMKQSAERLQQKKGSTRKLGYQPSFVIGNNSYCGTVVGVVKDNNLITLSEKTRNSNEGNIPDGQPSTIDVELQLNKKNAYIVVGSSVLIRDCDLFVGSGEVVEVYK